MTEQPPVYQDVLEEPPIDPDAMLVVRLEVWHSFALGRSPILNRDLARIFIAAELEDWNVREDDVDEPNDRSSRDHFVPVQVDFEHKCYTDSDYKGRAQYDVRVLFRHIAPALIFRFFLKIQSKPFVMSLTPLNVPSLHRSRYAQLFPINKLNIIDPRFLKPTEVKDIAALVTLLSNLDDGLYALSHIVEIFQTYMLLREPCGTQFSFMHRGDAEQVFNVTATVFENNPTLAAIVSDLRKRYDAMVNQAAVCESARLDAWRPAVTPFLEYQTKFSGVVKNLQVIKDGKAVTPQALYQTVLDLHAGSFLFNRARECLEPHLKRQVDQCRGMMCSPRYSSIGGLLTVIGGVDTAGSLWLGLLASAPLWLRIAGSPFIAGIIKIGCAQNEASAIPSEKKKAIMKFMQDLKGLTDAFNEARNDVIAVICRKFFRIELDHLGDHEKKAILEDFAVDVDALQHKDYCESLSKSGVDKLLASYKDLTADFQQMIKVCGLDVDFAEVSV